MKSLDEQVLSYSAYHRDHRNKMLHFIGVPLVTFAILIPLAWFRFIHGDVPVSGATLIYVAVFFYYLRLDRTVALIQAPFTLILYFLADMAATTSFGTSLSIFLVAFIAGWIVQLTGHYFEGRRPALVDNVFQIFNAPLFLTCEVLFSLGFRKDLKAKLDQVEAEGLTPNAAGL